MKKILLFGDTRHDASFTQYWSKDILTSLTTLGEEGVYLDLADKNFEYHLQEILHEGISFVISLYGVGLNIKVSDDEFLFNRLNIPVVCWMLDVLLSPNNFGLHLPLRHLLVACLNQEEIGWVRLINPSVRSAFFLPLGGSERVSEPKKLISERQIRLSYVGSFSPMFDRKWEGVPSGIEHILNDVIDHVVVNPMCPILEAAKDVFRIRNIELSNEIFVVFCRRYLNLANLYIREYCKQRVLDSFLNAGISIDIFGQALVSSRGGWESWKNAKWARLHGPCSYEESLKVAEESQIVVNAGVFPGGLHDRISMGMLQGAVVFTDPSSYYRECFIDGKDSLSFDWSHMEEIPGKITSLLADPERMQAMADLGRQKALEHHTWKSRMKRMLEVVRTYQAINGLEM